MGHENPLITLGVPKRVLVRERAFGTPGDVLKLAEASYRTLSKRYHPDLPGGDAELMAELGEAIEELRDLDALEFYIEELVGEEDIEKLYRQQQAQQQAARDVNALNRLAGGFDAVDQFRVLGISEPTSYFVIFEEQRLVIDVLSAHESRARLTALYDGAYNVSTDPSAINAEYRDGLWLEKYFIKSQSNERGEVTGIEQTQAPYKEFSANEPVKIVGFVRSDELYEGKAVAPSLAPVLDASSREVRLRWDVAANCWFLSKIDFEGNFVFPRLVLYRDGRFVLTDALVSSAPMKTE